MTYFISQLQAETDAQISMIELMQRVRPCVALKEMYARKVGLSINIQTHVVFQSWMYVISTVHRCSTHPFNYHTAIFCPLLLPGTDALFLHTRNFN